MLTKASTVLFWTLSTTIGFGPNSFPGITPGESTQAGGITATFTKDGLTLNLTARCSSADRLCPFRAEIHAPPPLFELINQVEYTISPEPRLARPPVTDASTRFGFEGRQMFGEKVYAEVTLKRRDRTSTEVVLLEGTIPYEAEVRPRLPNGLRFEDQYQPQYLEGQPSDSHYFRIRLRGEAAALNRIRSVEYQLPESHFSRPRVMAKAFDEYMIDGSMSSGARFEIVAVIRWKNGGRSTHAIACRVRLPDR